MEPIDVSWATFKERILLKKRVKFQEILGTDGVYNLLAFEGSIGASCRIAKQTPPSDDQTDYEQNYQGQANDDVSSLVITALEKDDTDLVLASDEQPFVGNVCVLSLCVPGTHGEIGARKIGGGYGFTDVFGWNDRVSRVEMIDKDYKYAGEFYPAEPAPGQTWAEAMPDGVPMGGYVDDDQPELKRGWRLWCEGNPGSQGGVDIDPLGGLAKLLAECWLVVTITKTDSSAATRACLNAWWGKPT